MKILLNQKIKNFTFYDTECTEKWTNKIKTKMKMAFVKQLKN